MILGMVLRPPYIIMMETINKPVHFLRWLKARLSIKHKDRNPEILSGIDNIISVLTPKKFAIDKKKILKVCKKNYPGFKFDKDESSVFDIGYSRKEKIEILNHVTQIVYEYYKND